MKKIISIIFFISFASSLAMEQKRVCEPGSSKGNRPQIFIAVGVREKTEPLFKAVDKKQIEDACFETIVSESVYDNPRIHDGKRDHFVLDVEAPMSNQEKLNYLHGDVHYTKRISIIKEMIEVEKIDPNLIEFGLLGMPWSPLQEAVLFEDANFVRYLLQHGAKSDCIVNNLEAHDKCCMLKKIIEENKVIHELLMCSKIEEVD